MKKRIYKTKKRNNRVTQKSRASKREKNNPSKGYITYLILGIAIFAFILASGVSTTVKQSTPQTNGVKYVLITPTNHPKSSTLQMGALPFTTITPKVFGTTTPFPTSSPTGNGRNIVWLNSYSTGEFAPHFTAWVWAQCSQASLAEVLNAYKKPGDRLFRIEELEAHALSIGVWDPIQGFLGPFLRNWKREGADYGFDVAYKSYVPTMQNLNALVNIANQGYPVIMGGPGHYIVLWGGDSQRVYLLDSSGHDLTWSPQSTNDSITLRGPHQRSQPTKASFLHGLVGFANYWNGVAIVATPHSARGPYPLP